MIDTDTDIQIWRNESIDYMISVFNGQINADYDSLNAIGLALHDVHVRDVALYYISTLDQSGIEWAIELLTRTMGFTVADKRAPVALLLAVIYGAIGEHNQCVLANTIALIADPEYPMANLVQVLLDYGGDAIPDFINDLLGNLTYDACRYGDNHA